MEGKDFLDINHFSDKINKNFENDLIEDGNDDHKNYTIKKDFFIDLK